MGIGKKMVAIFKRIKGSNCKWVSTADFSPAKPQPAKKNRANQKTNGRGWSGVG